MFTGIIQALGTIDAIAPLPAGRRYTIGLGALRGRAFNLGDSIAVNGACLTVVELADGRFAADLSNETLAVTTLGGLAVGSPVNLEPALTLADPLGGHLVTGHVDGIGSVEAMDQEGGTVLARFRVPDALARYFARKGSICVDGVSLTVNAVAGATVGVTLVPHTLAHTIMHTYAAGTPVNIEVDLVARYVERLLASDR
ncbi:MAG: riboflavin synthase [Chromatiales bacterium]|jgi:riboflavin synthase|nr:riboflavin synthase [Chromatiales bacterium]